MLASDVIRRLHQHRRWSNQRLLQAARALTVEQLCRSLQIGQGTVWRTLTHLFAAEYVWLEALQGNENPLLPGDLPEKLPGNQEGDGAIESLEQLASLWQTQEQRWSEYLAQLKDDDLEETVSKVSTSSGLGKTHLTCRADVLLHVCTHAQYTTAQLVNMLRQLGQQEMPDVMLITLARQEANESSRK